MAGELRVGVDIGGTFTDLCVLDDDGIVAVGKVLTTHDEPARAVEDVLREAVADRDLDPVSVGTLIHGTTLVTNALIERRGAVTALLTTEGFRDVLEMGREHRYELYDLGIELPRPLVPRHLRHGVPERTLADGTVEREVDVDHVARLAGELAGAGVEAVAVCFLHSHVDDANEQAARDSIARAAPGLRVALSSEVNPEIREYERSSTTVANVYVQAVVEDYLDDLAKRLAAVGCPRPPLIMLSNGGVATLEVAQQHPIRMLESGPAGGALGAVAFAAGLGVDDLMAFDMGGTTAKLSVIEDGRPLVTHTFEVARLYRMRSGSGLPVRAPVLDMIEIGAGGGSIAAVDPLGLVTVGPRSAGSEPGPVCYGRGGTEATVTDADLVLGYLGADSFLGGSMPLDLEAAREAIRTQVAEPMGIDVEQAAWGIHATVNENMANAARVHAVERGQDVARLPLFASGGNGPLHGPGLARALGSPSVLVPPAAGVLSALGFLSAPLSIDLVHSDHARLDELTAERAASRLERLRAEATAVLTASGVGASDVVHEHGCDMRFVGQGTETAVVVPAGGADWVVEAEAAFRAEYRSRYGTAAPRDVGVEVLTWRVNARGPVPEARLGYAPEDRGGDGESLTGRRRAWFPDGDLGDPGDTGSTGVGRWVDAAVHDRSRLRAGTTVDGPALVEERESTLVVPPGARATVGDDATILLELRP